MIIYWVKGSLEGTLSKEPCWFIGVCRGCLAIEVVLYKVAGLEVTPRAL